MQTVPERPPSLSVAMEQLHLNIKFEDHGNNKYATGAVQSIQLSAQIFLLGLWLKFRSEHLMCCIPDAKLRV
jgi:hypothetical protein